MRIHYEKVKIKKGIFTFPGEKNLFGEGRGAKNIIFVANIHPCSMVGRARGNRQYHPWMGSESGSSRSPGCSVTNRSQSLYRGVYKVY